MKDYTLIKKLKSGDEEAYRALYKLHYRALCLYAYKLVGDLDIAENMVSDVMYNIWTKRTNIEIQSSLRNYLIQSVKNRCYNYLKQEARRREIFQEYNHSTKREENDSVSTQEENPLNHIIAKELDIKLTESIDKLPDTTKKIFKLSRFSELRYSEIANETGLSIDSIKYHIKSALSKLREELYNND